MASRCWHCFDVDYARGYQLQGDLRLGGDGRNASSVCVFCRSFPASLRMVFWFSPGAASLHSRLLAEMEATECAPPDRAPSEESPHGLTLLQGSWDCLARPCA